jgi:cysteinyl-tRNA synthetase
MWRLLLLATVILNHGPCLHGIVVASTATAFQSKSITRRPHVESCRSRLHPIFFGRFHGAAPSSPFRLLQSQNAEDATSSDWYSDYNPDDYQYVDPSERNSRPSFNDRRRRFLVDRDNQSSAGGRPSRGGRSTLSARYERDASRDTSNVNVALVESLIAERNDARYGRNFELADRIRDELLQEHGVAVSDRDKSWRSGCSTGGSGVKGRRDGRPTSRREWPPQDFGPLGHDYNLAPDMDMTQMTRSLTEDQIHAKLAQRLQCKLSRNFVEADAVQLALEAEGVFVHDGLKQWRGDGKRFGDVRFTSQSPNARGPSKTANSRSSREKPYQQSEHSLSSLLSPDEILEIQNMVEDRFESKVARKFVTADKLRDKLRNQYNVMVDDKLREWSVGGNFGPQASNSDRAYTQSPLSQNVEGADLSNIVSAVNRRGDAKRKRNFDDADSIRDDLLDEYNVVINDKLRQWSMGGMFQDDDGKMPGRAGDSSRQRNEGGYSDRGSRNERPYQRRGESSLSVEDVSLVESLLTERAEAKANRDFAVADDIRDELRERFDVSIDDRNREWHVGRSSSEYSFVQGSQSDGAADLDEKTVATITTMIQNRQKAKVERDYDTADEIRSSLRQDFNVIIDDRTKEWMLSEELGEMTRIDRHLNGKKDVLEEYDWRGGGDDDEVIVETSKSNQSVHAENISMSEGAVGGSSALASVENVNWNSWTVPQLKDKLREAGLPVSGVKAVLIERLVSERILN